ncbi:EAL domain-containing protein [Pseudomonas sp. RP23018S]|uniref:EAL domain-containing response regulator n=1 Tax=Pseudomonas sp. RP23018S TaxID=3096037 RepID=UPI002ACADEFB|nr:EAL domain-containing protein [Pseudomonas sp. RP23018S]MDZ5604552.1 EAL domain-containing protein [Pseudomonas sp. RP23018S]
MTVYRVLIVEDHPLQHYHLAALFDGVGGFEVDLAWDGAGAMQRLAGQAYDLLLTDLIMPNMDGVQLVQRLAQLPCPPALALMTAASPRMLAGAGQVAEHLGLTVAGLLGKPIGPREILELHNRLDAIAAKAHLDSQRRRGCRSAATLAAAIGSGEIQAWFQPKKSLRDGRIVGAETLARWLHPEEGLLLPGAFLEDLERAHLEVELLTSMLEQTLAAQALWAKLGYTLPVSINLPTHLLDRTGLIERLLEQVRASNGEPKLITFELTESSVTEFSSNYYAGACRLRMMGFGLAQDDFGRGYSSYFKLVSTPFTELKIDRSLVLGCAEDDVLASVVLSILELGRDLDLVTVAEGVETSAQVDVLRRMQCDQVQGFIVSPAVPWETMLALISLEQPVPIV